MFKATCYRMYICVCVVIIMIVNFCTLTTPAHDTGRHPLFSKMSFFVFLSLIFSLIIVGTMKNFVELDVFARLFRVCVALCYTWDIL